MAHPMTYDELCIQNARLQGMVTQAGMTARLYMKRSNRAVALLREVEPIFLGDVGKRIRAFLSAVAEEGDARSEGEDAHDDGEPLERETEDRDEPRRDQPDAETDAPDFHR